MQIDFHYYATYCAAYIAGYSHEDSLKIAYSDMFVDCCSRTLIEKLHGPVSAASTQLQLEMMKMKTDIIGLQNITRIWSSFHFLPGNLNADVKGMKPYRDKYRLICNPNSDLLVDTVNNAQGKDLTAVGIAMHVLCDTWAHRYFAGTPSLVINNTDYCFYELISDGKEETEYKIDFRHNPKAPDDPAERIYTNSLYQLNEKSIMNLGHGRAGHLPDYSYIRYKYLPAWKGYKFLIKDNPHDYYLAFCQMVYALKCLKTPDTFFEKDVYAFDAVEPWKGRIDEILRKRQVLACKDWKEFGEQLSGEAIEDFDIEKFQPEYLSASEDEKDDTFLGSFFISAMAQKSLVTNKIFKSGNLLAGISIDFEEFGFRGIKDFKKLLKYAKEGINK